MALYTHKWPDRNLPLYNGCFSSSSLFIVYFQAFVAFLQQLNLSTIEKWKTIKTVLQKEDNIIKITYLIQNNFFNIVSIILIKPIVIEYIKLCVVHLVAC